MGYPKNQSQFVCWRDGLPVHSIRGGWKHALSGTTGAIPRHRRHYPVPVRRTLYQECFAITTTRERAMEIAEEYKALDKKLQAEHPQRRR